jgi:hypothetical protein
VVPDIAALAERDAPELPTGIRWGAPPDPRYGPIVIRGLERDARDAPISIGRLERDHLTLELEAKVRHSALFARARLPMRIDPEALRGLIRFEYANDCLLPPSVYSLMSRKYVDQLVRASRDGLDGGGDLTPLAAWRLRRARNGWHYLRIIEPRDDRLFGVAWDATRTIADPPVVLCRGSGDDYASDDDDLAFAHAFERAFAPVDSLTEFIFVADRLSEYLYALAGRYPLDFKHLV